MLFGATGMAVCQFIVAGVGTGVGTTDQAGQNALIAFVCIYIFFFACSWGPCKPFTDSCWRPRCTNLDHIGAWVVTGEIFPLKVRAKSLSMTTASNWLLNWGKYQSDSLKFADSETDCSAVAIAYATPYMVDSGAGNANLGAKVFFVWGSFCFVCIFFGKHSLYENLGPEANRVIVWALIYETKGLSLEQVDELYGKVSKAWQSPGFVPTVSFQEVQEVAGGDQARRSTLAEIEQQAVRRKSVASEKEV